MRNALLILLPSALSIGFVHTLMGPDHYIPFIAMAKARKWSLPRTIVITALCGIGHVGSALGLGMVGVAVGLTVTKLNFITSVGGAIATWVLIIFGLLYFVWGLRSAARAHHHGHSHHPHSHNHEKKSLKEITPWILFTIFVLGPCEALIPLILYPAIEGQTLDVILITIVFGIATICVMLFMVVASIFGMRQVKFSFLEKYGNALAGMIICTTGCVIKIFGL